MLRRPRRKKKPLASSRRRILDLLKVQGPGDSQTLASHLGISAMAVRQHLYALHKEKLVTYGVEGRRLGRPAKIWQLTAGAEELFPDAHADLCVSLVNAIHTSSGKSGINRALAVIADEQVDSYEGRIPDGALLAQKLEVLARFRTEQGYLAELQANDNGIFTLVQNHCPIRTAAAVCPGLCSTEVETFQRVLGPGAVIERLEHIQTGDRRCLYSIRPKPDPSTESTG